jgi:hypothetical protein
VIATFNEGHDLRLNEFCREHGHYTSEKEKLGKYAIPNDDFIRAPITRPAVTSKNYEIKPNLLSLVQQNQFGGSAAEDSGMHLNTFTEICVMMRIKDVNPNAVKLRLFPFFTKRKSKRLVASFA